MVGMRRTRSRGNPSHTNAHKQAIWKPVILKPNKNAIEEDSRTDVR